MANSHLRRRRDSTVGNSRKQYLWSRVSV